MEYVTIAACLDCRQQRQGSPKVNNPSHSHTLAHILTLYHGSRILVITIVSNYYLSNLLLGTLYKDNHEVSPSEELSLYIGERKELDIQEVSRPRVDLLLAIPRPLRLGRILT